MPASAEAGDGEPRKPTAVTGTPPRSASRVEPRAAERRRTRKRSYLSPRGRRGKRSRRRDAGPSPSINPYWLEVEAASAS